MGGLCLGWICLIFSHNKVEVRNVSNSFELLNTWFRKHCVYIEVYLLSVERNLPKIHVSTWHGVVPTNNACPFKFPAALNSKLYHRVWVSLSSSIQTALLHCSLINAFHKYCRKFWLVLKRYSPIKELRSLQHKGWLHHRLTHV